MAKKKRRQSLPRLTLLAFNRNDLVGFVNAVEALRLIVRDLDTTARTLRMARKPRPNNPINPTGGANGQLPRNR